MTSAPEAWNERALREFAAARAVPYSCVVTI
jgi:hypothetical protein